jgi:hypothetical protein
MCIGSICFKNVHILVSGGTESGNDSGEIDFKRINQEAVSELIFLVFLHLIVHALHIAICILCYVAHFGALRPFLPLGGVQES